jgi:hypothetical protein
VLLSLLLWVVFYTGRSHFMPGLHSWKTLRKSNTKFPLQPCISWGLSDWQPNPIQCMTIPKVDKRGPAEYISVIYAKYTYLFPYISVQHSYLFLMK